MVASSPVRHDSVAAPIEVYQQPAPWKSLSDFASHSSDIDGNAPFQQLVSTLFFTFSFLFLVQFFSFKANFIQNSFRLVFYSVFLYAFLVFLLLTLAELTVRIAVNARGADIKAIPGIMAHYPTTTTISSLCRRRIISSSLFLHR